MVSEADLRALAASLPETEERQTWGHPTFRVGGHIFLGVDEKAGWATVKATKQAQQALIAAGPSVYSEAPRMGQHGWVRVTLAEADHEELAELVTDAWRLIAPAELVKRFDAS
jgi:hypothetical protein